MKNIITICSIFLLTACTSQMEKSVAFGKYEPDKDAFVASSSKYVEKVENFKTHLFDDGKKKVEANFAASATFEKYPEGGTLKLGCNSTVCYNRTSRILAGEYRLTEFRIGEENKYDSNKCGVIKFDIKPGEIIYLGRITGAAILSSRKYSSKPIHEVLMPEFKADEITQYELESTITGVKWHYEGLNDLGKLDDAGRKRMASITRNDVIVLAPVNIDKQKEAYCKSLSTETKIYSDDI